MVKIFIFHQNLDNGVGGRNIFKKTLTTAREGRTSPSPLSSGIEGFSEFQHPPFREEDGKDAKIGRFFVNIWVSFLMEFLNKLEKTGIKTARKAYRLSDRPPDTHEGLQTFRNIDFITFQTRLSQTINNIWNASREKLMDKT